MPLCLQLPDGALALSEQAGEQTAGKAGPQRQSRCSLRLGWWVGEAWGGSSWKDVKA